MNGVFNDLVKDDVVADGVAVGLVLYGRKVLVSFLWGVTVCFVGGFTSQAHAQPVRDLASAFNEALGEKHFTNQLVVDKEYPELPNEEIGDSPLRSRPAALRTRLRVASRRNLDFAEKECGTARRCSVRSALPVRENHVS
ncbi:MULTISPECIES: hypothetical protein [Pseudomonas]|uniref:hypothetical protein n=1 Tax=Pseudomonas TaxID=286 RepID=UPI001FF66D73|nr:MULTISPECIES: hypothetical protein [Pseudomonas]